jgi:hypothetical protein
MGAGDETEWEKTEEAQNLLQQLKSHQADQKIFTRQKLRLESGGPQKSLRRSFMELFSTSKVGLGMTIGGQGRRDSGEQSRFRAALIQAYNSRYPDPHRPWLWDPILQKFVSEQNAQAAHLFAYAHGQATMDAIFGPTDPPELFSPLNGLILCQEIEHHFDKGFFAIVPRLPDNPSIEDISAWNTSDPKEYKIRILNLNHKEIDNVIHPLVEKENLTWRSLDGANVEFRSNFRPRARYLYFHFCVQILRLTWGTEPKKAETLRKELGKVFWGTPGRYLPRNMLRAFVEELGHEYEALLEGAMEDETDADVAVDNGDSEILLATASHQIKASARKKGDEDDEDEDEDEDEESTSSN